MILVNSRMQRARCLGASCWHGGSNNKMLLFGNFVKASFSRSDEAAVGGAKYVILSNEE
jgi:hypothetical protein